MKAMSHAERIDAALLQVEPRPAEQRVVDLDALKKTRRGRRIDNWLAVALIVVASIFAGAVVLYVLSPAISTLVSGQPWTPQGP